MSCKTYTVLSEVIAYNLMIVCFYDCLFLWLAVSSFIFTQFFSCFGDLTTHPKKFSKGAKYFNNLETKIFIFTNRAQNFSHIQPRLVLNTLAVDFTSPNISDQDKCLSSCSLYLRARYDRWKLKQELFCKRQ